MTLEMFTMQLFASLLSGSPTSALTVYLNQIDGPFMCVRPRQPRPSHTTLPILKLCHSPLFSVHTQQVEVGPLLAR